MAQSDGDATHPGARIRLEIAPTLAELTLASAQVREFLREKDVGKRAIFAIETAIEELVTNAIKYAGGTTQSGAIGIEARVAGDRAGLIVEYGGCAFDPTKTPTPDVNRSLEDMPIGGLGIHLVRELTKTFEYERLNNRNRVRIWVPREN